MTLEQSLITWPGGKWNSVKVINSIMPHHKCYIELFFGGGSIFFGKDPSPVECINDLNGELINFWRVIQRQPDKFLERSKYELYSRELFDEYKSDWDNGKHENLGDVERSFRFYCLIRESFSAIFSSGWSYGCSKSNPATFQNAFGLVDAVHKRLRDVYIENSDFQYVIEHYDCPNGLFLCDPPYVLANIEAFYFKSYNKKQQNEAKFTLYDHQRLYNALSNIKGKFILTIDDCAWIRERYCDGQDEMGKSRKFWWVENTLYYSVADAESRKHVTELIICNYDIGKAKAGLMGRTRKGLGDF